MKECWRMNWLKKLALIGAGNPRWQETIIAFQKEEGAVFTNWTFRVRDHELKLPENQLKSDGEFKIFFYEPMVDQQIR